jgi:hypothetical protein
MSLLERIRISGWRQGSFTKLENLIFNHHTRYALFRAVAQQNLAFFAPRTRIGFGFPASAACFTKLEYLILNQSSRIRSTPVEGMSLHQTRS